jgi:hypothetical protein
MYMSANQNSENTYCYNADVENNHVVAQYVYDRKTVANGNSEYIVLNPKIKYDYVYDSEDRLITRTTSRWDGGEWQPCDKMEYEYTPMGYCVTLSHWDLFRQRFNKPEVKTVYTLMPDDTHLNVSTYICHNYGKPDELINSIVVSNA